MFLGVSCIICFMTGNDWKRVGDAVVRRRSELGMTTREALAHATKLSTRMLSDLEKARRTNFDPGALARVEIALQWEAGSIEAILDGREPTPIHVKQPDSDEPPRIERPYLHLCALLWSSVSELAVAVAAESGMSRQLRDKALRALAITVDVASEFLLASPDAPAAKPLLQEMFETYARLRNELEGDDHGVETAPEPDASTEGDEDQEALVTRDDPQQRRRGLLGRRSTRQNPGVSGDEHGDVGDQFGGA